MKTDTFDIEFLTPCFCAGADQKKAEIRASAIRGQLHWWFRCLGGSLDEERQVFGNVRRESAIGSSFSVRVQHVHGSGLANWMDVIRPSLRPMSPTNYLLGFFCQRTGRMAPGGALPPQSKARVILTYLKPPPSRLEQAVRAFFSMGAIGFRATRAAGAFACSQHAMTNGSWGTLTDELRTKGFRICLDERRFATWTQLLEHAGRLLKEELREGLDIKAGNGGRNPNPLGSAIPRQASVVHLRPVRIDRELRLALVEAPHERVLGEPARRQHGNKGSILDMYDRR